MAEQNKEEIRREMLQEILMYIASGKHAENTRRLQMEHDDKVREWERTERDEDLKQGK
jgi:hypothetical protein